MFMHEDFGQKRTEVSLFINDISWAIEYHSQELDDFLHDQNFDSKHLDSNLAMTVKSLQHGIGAYGLDALFSQERLFKTGLILKEIELVGSLRTEDPQNFSDKQEKILKLLENLYPCCGLNLRRNYLDESSRKKQ